MLWVCLPSVMQMLALMRALLAKEQIKLNQKYKILQKNKIKIFHDI